MDVLTESAPHRRAEALVQMARHACAHAEDCNGQGGNRAILIFGLPHQSLLDGLGTAGTPDGKRLPAAAARRMACDAGIIPAVYDGDSQILDFGRTSRSTPPGLRRYIIATRRRLRLARLRPAPSWCEAHHRINWGYGGETKEDVLELLCVHHHGKVHEGGWTITIGTDPDRTPWFHPPDGRPPLRGQRRPLFRPATDRPRRT